MALADTLLTTSGPYTWADSCGGSMKVTVRVYKDVPGFTGLYKWDYEIENDSINSRDGDDAVNGIGDFTIRFPNNVPDLQNVTPPANWNQFVAPTSAGTDFDTSTNYGPDSNPATGGQNQPIYAIQPGQTVHLTFTTFPRAVQVLEACALDSDGYLVDGLNCAYATKANLVIAGIAPQAKRQPLRSATLHPRLVCNDTTTGELIVPGDPTEGLSVSQPPTPNAVTSEAPSVDPLAVSDTTLAFATDDASLDFVVLKNSGTVTVNGTNFSGASGGDQIQWQIDRDPTDTVDTGTPTLSGAPGAQVTFNPSTAGNFRLIAYIDTDASGTFDNGEQVAIARFAIVQATLQSSNVSLSTDWIAGIDTSSQGTSTATTGGSTVNTAPMQLTAQYLLEGGGSSSTIGTGAVGIGNVGNLVGSDSFSINYPGSRQGTGTENPGGTTPMVDTLNFSTVSQGGTAPFRANSNTSDGISASGRVVNLTSADRPQFAWRLFHPTTGNPWDETAGGIGFREFVVAFSSSFQRTYLALHQAAWAVTIIGTNEDSVWDDGNGTQMSTVTGDSALQSVTGLQMQVLGSSYGKNNSITYQP